ncbi:competence/damage-inducible protein A [Erysipelothrix urinaevulpis]|uniref:competence/damage-inducible protein A n=1 Tax=Erysipelothrix urinaevulpis TaxID=2683717 RepID=UPI0013568656|nr:competence/damage-inducible protein A [Erysipelothrix urinaevulpis]
MNVEIFSIGTELLLGDIVNTNAQFIALKLAELGLSSYHQTTVGDNPERLEQALRTSLKRSDIILCTGGLGPTSDDLTKEIVAKLAGLDLVLDQESLNRIESYFSFKQQAMPYNNQKQAMIPKGATVLENQRGTAPGIMVELEGKTIILMPGVPHEMKAMFVDQVIPYLENLSEDKIVSSHLYLYGIGESDMEMQIKDLMKASINPSIAPYASGGTLMLRVTAKAKTQDEAQALIDPVIENLSQIFKDYVYSIDQENMAHVLVNLLKQMKLTLALAESCTGGMIAEMITSIPGSSQIFSYGVTSYSNEAKQKLLNVKEETLKQYGAVSTQVVKEMASGVRTLSDADIAISVSGIAGPGGGTSDKPVGLVYLCVTTHDKTLTKKLLLGRGRPNERDSIRHQTSLIALKTVIDLVKDL